MKIAIVAASLHGGGTEYVTRTWIEQLGRHGHTVTYVGLEEPGQRRMRHAERVRRVRSAVVGQQFDAVLAMATYPALVTLTALKLLPSVDTKVLISERRSDEPIAAASARSRFPGVITEVKRDGLAATVEIQAGPHRVLAFITREAADQLGLEPGMEAVATVKATSVMVNLPEH